MKRFAMVLAVVGLLASWVGFASAFPVTFAPGDYDNTANTVVAGPTPVNNQTTGLFRDIFWWSINNGQPRVGSADFINSGNSLTLQGNSAAPGPGPIQSLNFTGPSVSGGQTYLSIYDTTPADGPATKNLFDATGGLRVSADILFVKHSSSGGVVAMYNEGQDALAVVAHNGDGNNQDNTRVSLVFKSQGSSTVLAETTLAANTFQTAASANGNKTGLDFWYRIVMDLKVTGDQFEVFGTFFNHTDPNDPNSALGSQIIAANLHLIGSVSDPDIAALHLSNSGEIGLVAIGNESIALPDNVGISLTNFNASTAVPEPATMFLGGLGLIAFGYAARRRLFGRQN